MKIIFLDIDGVLNHQSYYRSGNWQKNKMRDIDPKSMELLNELIEKTGAKIVISSSWRIGRTVEELRTELNDLGLKGEIIDITGRASYGVRGIEIYGWLQDNAVKGFQLGYGFKDYVILDDSTDMMLWQKDNFIEIDNEVGITRTTLRKAGDILKTIIL